MTSEKLHECLRIGLTTYELGMGVRYRLLDRLIDIISFVCVAHEPPAVFLFGPLVKEVE